MRHLLLGLLLLVTTSPAMADHHQPIDALRKGIEAGIRILNAPEFRAPDRKQEQQQNLRVILEQLFSFHEFSRRVLAAHWNRFTPSQRETFVSVFAEFLGKYYMGQLQERYQDERVIYLGQAFDHPVLARTQIQVVWQGQHIPVELRMINRMGVWKIYDIEAFGVSALSFYRAQFKSLLRQETPAQVIDRIRRQIRKFE